MASPLSPATVPRLCPRFRFQWEPAQQQWVLLYPEGMIVLNGSAGTILRRLQDAPSVEELIAALQAEFPGVALEADVLEFLEQAHARGWITFE